MQNWILLSANIPPPWHFGSALRAIRSALRFPKIGSLWGAKAEPRRQNPKFLSHGVQRQWTGWTSSPRRSWDWVSGPDWSLTGVTLLWPLCLFLFKIWLCRRRSVCILSHPPRISRSDRRAFLHTSQQTETCEDQTRDLATDGHCQGFDGDAAGTAKKSSQPSLCPDSHWGLPKHVIHLLRQCEYRLFFVGLCRTM